jgi:septation ring formation regulator EzrA
MKNQKGYNVSQLFRAFLNVAGADWKTCEDYGRQFDEKIEDADWLDTDNGTSFEKYTSLKERYSELRDQYIKQSNELGEKDKLIADILDAINNPAYPPSTNKRKANEIYIAGVQTVKKG